jgi:ligand-binding sensor domain-containing protein
MWVGTDAGLVRIPREALDHFDRSLVQTYHAGVGLSDQVMSLHLSRNGVIWVGTNRGLYRMDRGKMLAVIPGEDISRVEEASDGRLLIITGNGFVEGTVRESYGTPNCPANWECARMKSSTFSRIGKV